VRGGAGHGDRRTAWRFATGAERGRSGAGVSQRAAARAASGDAQSFAVHRRRGAERVHTRGAREKVLYQQPCYCHCDRSQGHTSLLDCFASKHGSGCGVCMREAIYSYEQSHKGKTAAQIRAGIERGEWQQVDMSKYQTPVAAK